ncbi:MAG TPA: hypothetical protein VEC19_03210 [Usitatibacter sp.]|nr:hypothetical protein [Usitatibacter sp.]
MNALHRYALLLIAALLAAIAGGCASTEITSAWRDPALSSVPFRKVLVVFQHNDPALRHALERTMAAEIPNSVPAHAIFGDEEVRDVERVKVRVRDEGFDSAVIMRLTGVEREVSYVPGRLYAVPSYYHGFWGYYGWGWRSVYEPGYMRSDRVVNIATNVYSVRDDKLVWASQSETFNPATLRTAVAEVVRVTSRATGEALRARG